MKKRYIIAGSTGLLGVAVGAKLLRREAEVGWDEHAERLRLAERGRFVTVEGVRVHLQEAGAVDAPVIFLIHGFCASTQVWDEVLVPIAESGFRVIAVDLVGFGFSEKPREWEYTIEAQARVLVGLMDELGIESAALVGSSYGGAVAATCALNYPERVERLVLVCAVSNDDPKKQMLLRLASARLMGDVLSPLVLDSPKLMRWRMRRIYASGASAHLLEADRLRGQHLPLRAASTQRAVLRTLRRWSASHVTREAHRIRQPTLLVWGEDDREVPLAGGERLHALIPHSRLVVFPGCGHMPQEERPEEFAGLVAGFCRPVTGHK